MPHSPLVLLCLADILDARTAHDLDVKFYEDRAAHFAAAQLPLIVALAGKNNLISFLVGIGHEKVRK